MMMVVVRVAMAATMLIITTMALSILPSNFSILLSILSFILLIIVASRSFKSCLVTSVVSKPKLGRGQDFGLLLRHSGVDKARLQRRTTRPWRHSLGLQ